MKKKVTYLFGAGASANALPIVKFFNERLERFLKFSEDYNQEKNNSFVAVLISNIRKVLDECKKHSTVDTVAKKYFHTYGKSKNELENLKKVLFIFFLYEQVTKQVYFPLSESMKSDNVKKSKSINKTKQGNIDVRYDSFIASLLSQQEDKFLLPNNINIITWNYDCQFELAFKQFSNDSMYEIQRLLNVFPFLTPEGHPDHWNRIKNESFKVLHLNGQAHNFYKEFHSGDNYQTLYDEIETLKNEFFLTIEKKDQLIDSRNITFSWERKSNSLIGYDEVNQIIEAGKEIMNSTQILVITGYSFPYFNRDVDKELLNDKKFEKIYIQDTNALNIRTQFINFFTSETKEENIISYDNIDQFLVPPEFDAEYSPRYP